MKHAWTAFPALMLLAACNGDEVPADDDPREASGEVLEGTISDDMIPLDQLRSQPPLAEPDPEEGGSATGAGNASASDEGDADEAGEPAAAEPESAAEPTEE
ncbi:hypothetical protein [Aurantiacibacter sediminis]|uniref:Uncharacterized protein n=1 Tax=Aurantiacibacter sediminis TaxID=2793064 RepID=A0ABS0N6W3_9SPHN|nr:hypothetical protein [Aurantiacibacter sediminis]MBH5323528.1 hypothetical protein [Aurantiacibacter sediminis]